LKVILNVYNHDYNLMEAVEAPRVHHQLMPDVVDIESGYSASDVNFLSTRGHNVTVSDILLAKSEVQAVMRDTEGTVFAASDSKKHGIAAGY
jgi:gamma-glutamyltranspeptidase/glutathione hydrolase/leukotriene-C4 hydrolase